MILIDEEWKHFPEKELKTRIFSQFESKFEFEKVSFHRIIREKGFIKKNIRHYNSKICLINSKEVMSQRCQRYSDPGRLYEKMCHFDVKKCVFLFFCNLWN